MLAPNQHVYDIVIFTLCAINIYSTSFIAKFQDKSSCEPGYNVHLMLLIFSMENSYIKCPDESCPMCVSIDESFVFPEGYSYVTFMPGYEPLDIWSTC